MAYFRCGISNIQKFKGTAVDVTDLPAPIASFRSNASGVKLDSLKVLVEAQQDLHGYDKPWAGGGGKNKLGLSRTNIITSATASNTTPRAFTENDIWVGLTANNYFNNANVNSYSVGNNSVTVNSKVSGYGVAFPIKCSANTTYTFSQSTNYTVNFGFYDVSGNYLDNTGYATFTTPNDCVWVTVLFRPATNDNYTYTNPQLELGSTATSYAPYENICPITGWSGANVTRTGKNLFSYDLPIRDGYWSGTTFNGTNNIVTKENATNWKYIRIYVKGLTTITLSGFDSNGGTNCAWLGSEDTSDVLGTFSSANKNGSKTVPNGAKYLALVIFNIKENYANYPNAQLEVGSTASDFSPYNGNTYTIQFGDTYYGCEVDVTNGVLRVTKGFKTFTGDSSENWTNTYNAFNIIISDAKQIQIPKANWLKGLTSQSIFNLQSGECAFASSGALNFNCKYDQTADLTAWKTYLASNNLQVYYELATPFTIQLTPQQIEQLEENNIWADTGDVSECKYIQISQIGG